MSEKEKEEEYRLERAQQAIQSLLESGNGENLDGQELWGYLDDIENANIPACRLEPLKVHLVGIVLDSSNPDAKKIAKRLLKRLLGSEKKINHCSSSG